MSTTIATDAVHNLTLDRYGCAAVGRVLHRIAGVSAGAGDRATPPAQQRQCDRGAGPARSRPGAAE